VRCELANTGSESISQLSDEELIKRYQQEPSPTQQQTFVNELFQRHYRQVILWCLRIAGNRDLAADWAQDVFLKAFRGLHTFKGGAKFSTWLYSVTRNHCFTQVSRWADLRIEPPDASDMNITEKRENPYQLLERKETRRYVRRLLADSLDEVELRVMSLHFAEGIPLDTVSRMLNLCNISGAKAYVVSAKRKLSRALERAELSFQNKRTREQGHAEQ
jgi:RNA polymerase sigma-70 factor, ECF subfamily